MAVTRDKAKESLATEYKSYVLTGAVAPRGENRRISRRLWPFIDSVTYTGTCLRPSWTAMVWPTISGITVERRLQVLMTLLSPDLAARSTLASRCSSTKGPLESDLLTAVPHTADSRQLTVDSFGLKTGDWRLATHLCPF